MSAAAATDGIADTTTTAIANNNKTQKKKKVADEEKEYKKRFDALTKLHKDARHRMLSSHCDRELQSAMETLKSVGAQLGRLNEEFPTVAAERKERRLRLQAKEQERQERQRAKRRRRGAMHDDVSDDDGSFSHDEDTLVSQLTDVYSP